MLRKPTNQSKDFVNRSRMNIYSIFVVGLLTISCLISCRKDLLLGENDKDLKKVREWYYAQIGKSKNFIQLEDQLPVQLQENALWDKAEVNTLHDGTRVIKVPIESNISNILKKKGSLQIVIEDKNESYRSRYVGNTNTPSDNKPIKVLYDFAFLNNAKVMSTSKPSHVNNAENKETEQNSNRGVDCTDWYWVTKTFVDGELVNTTSEYVGQTCVGDFSGGGTSGADGTGVGPSDGKFGEDPNCNNCVISPQNFLALKAYARDAGLIVRPAFATTLTLADGSVHTGIITEIRSPDGALAAAFFNPDNSVGGLISGYNYSIGKNGPTGTNSNNNSNIVLSNNAIWSFGTTLPDNGGYGPNTTYTRNADLQSFINTLGATVTKAVYLDNHYKVFEVLRNYLNANGQTQDNIEFSNWAVEYLMENTDVTISELIAANNISNSTINLPNLIDTTGLSPYPAFKTIVTNLSGFLNDQPEVVKALSRYTGFSNKKIMELMQPGKGPKIQLVSNLVDTFGRPCFGQYKNGILKVKKELVVGLDKVQSPNRYRAIGMLLSIVTLHEFVHYGRDVNKLVAKIKLNGFDYDAGYLFELSISPPYQYSDITRNNAIDWVTYFNFNIND